MKMKWYTVGAMCLILAGLGVVGYKLSQTYFYDTTDNAIEATELTEAPPTINIQKQLAKLSDPKQLPANTVVVNVPILMYHYVENVKNKNDVMRVRLNTTPMIFEEQLKTLVASHYTFMTESELAEVIGGKTQLPPKPILLTFDDGYRDFYTDAYPLLKKYQVKATQYVISGFLNRPNHLTTSQLQEIASAGLVEIGAHTVNHVWLKGLSRDRVMAEIVNSRAQIEKLIHKPVVSFAYPFGAFDEQAARVVNDAGFTSAVSTMPGVSQSTINEYYLFRLRAGGRVGESLTLWLNGVGGTAPKPAK